MGAAEAHNEKKGTAAGRLAVVGGRRVGQWADRVSESGGVEVAACRHCSGADSPALAFRTAVFSWICVDHGTVVAGGGGDDAGWRRSTWFLAGLGAGVICLDYWGNAGLSK